MNYTYQKYITFFKSTKHSQFWRLQLFEIFPKLQVFWKHQKGFNNSEHFRNVHECSEISKYRAFFKNKIFKVCRLKKFQKCSKRSMFSYSKNKTVKTTKLSKYFDLSKNFDWKFSKNSKKFENFQDVTKCFEKPKTNQYLWKTEDSQLFSRLWLNAVWNAQWPIVHIKPNMISPNNLT
jgi:hypothetical protein